MLFQNQETKIQLEIAGYEFPPDGGAPGSDDRNWLVMRCAWTDEEGVLRKDSNSCLLTYELRELAAGLKVLRAELKESYHSDFVESYFQLDAWAEKEHFRISVSFVLPNTMDGDDTAEVECVMTQSEIRKLTDELDALCMRYPDRA